MEQSRFECDSGRRVARGPLGDGIDERAEAESQGYVAIARFPTSEARRTRLGRGSTGAIRVTRTPLQNRTHVRLVGVLASFGTRNGADDHRRRHHAHAPSPRSP